MILVSETKRRMTFKRKRKQKFRVEWDKFQDSTKNWHGTKLVKQ
jgi:hypothetical protein